MTQRRARPVAAPCRAVASGEARRHDYFSAARRGWPSPFAGHHARSSVRPPVAQQGPPLSGRPADRRRVRGRHAHRRPVSARPARPSAHHRALASRAADQRGPRAGRKRSRPRHRRRACPPWQGRQAARGRYGPLGLAADPAVAGLSSGAARRRLAVRHARADRRAAVVTFGGTQHAALAVAAGVRRRFAPHQLRHAHAVEMAREGVPLTVVQRQLGHANLGITSIYLQASTTARSSTASSHAPAPTLPASAGLR